MLSGFRLTVRYFELPIFISYSYKSPHVSIDLCSSDSVIVCCLLLLVAVLGLSGLAGSEVLASYCTAIAVLRPMATPGYCLYIHICNERHLMSANAPLAALQGKYAGLFTTNI